LSTVGDSIPGFGTYPSILVDMGFGERLKEASRLAKVEYSQTAISKALGVRKQTVDRWMSDSLPAADTLFEIAEKWGLSPRWLATGKGDPRPTIEAGIRKGLEPYEAELIAKFRTADPRWQLAIRLLVGLAGEDQVQAATDINVIVARLLGMKPKNLRYPSDKEVEKKLGLPPNVRRIKNRP
jgi:transcriptional regulator with XRE-family HTH domain